MTLPSGHIPHNSGPIQGRAAATGLKPLHLLCAPVVTRIDHCTNMSLHRCKPGGKAESDGRERRERQREAERGREGERERAQDVKPCLHCSQFLHVYLCVCVWACVCLRVCVFRVRTGRGNGVGRKYQTDSIFRKYQTDSISSQGVYAYIYVCLCVFTTRAHVFVNSMYNVHTCIHTKRHTYIRRMDRNIHMYTYTYMCACVCVCARARVYTHIQTQRQKGIHIHIKCHLIAGSLNRE